MADSSVRYKIEADNSDAIKATDQVNKANASIGESAQAGMGKATQAYLGFTAAVAAGAKGTEGALKSAGDAVGGLTHLITKSGEAAAAAVVAVKGYGAALAGYSSIAGTVAASGDAIANSYRLVRLVLSPTVFTASSLAAGLLVEETVKLTYSTGKLIEQRSILAARSGLDIRQVNELAIASNLAGKSNEFYLSTLKSLQRGSGTSAGQQALGTLGIYGVDKADPDTLARVGAAFQKIQDPVERARVGVALFGDDFEKVQDQLTSRIGTTIDKVREFGTAIGPEQAKDIDLAKRNLQSLGTVFEGTFDAARLNILRLKNEIADFAGRSINLFFPDPNRSQALSNLSARGQNPFFGGGLTSPLQQEQERLRASDIVGPDARRIYAAQSAFSGAALSDATAAALGIQQNVAGSREGIEAELGRQRSRRDDALAKLAEDQASTRTGGDGTLSPSERSAFSQQAVGAQQLVSLNQAKVDALDKARQGTEDVAAAEKRALDFRKRSLEEEYTGLARVDIIERETLAELGKSATARKNIAIGIAALREREERKLDQETIDFNNNQEGQEFARSGFGQAFAFTATQFGFQRQASERNRQTSESSALFGVTEAGFARDTALRGLDNVNAQTVGQKKALEQAKFDIEQEYLVKSLQVRSDAVDRENQHEIDDLKDQLQGRQITQETFDQLSGSILRRGGEQGRQLIAETGAGISAARDRSQTGIDSLTKEQNQREFDSIKSSASGLIDTLFTRTQDLGRAVGDFFKHAVLGPLEEIASSQVAKLIFGAINPGQSVSFAGGGGGAGKFGKFGGILGSLGFGTQPVFSTAGGTVATATTPDGSIDFAGGGGTGLPGFGGAANLAASLPGLLGLNFGGDVATGPVDRTGTPVNGPVSLGGSTLAGTAGLSAGAAAGSGFNVGSLTGLVGKISPLAAITAGIPLALSGLFANRQTAGSSASTISGFGLTLGGLGAKFGSQLGIGTAGGAAVGAEAGIGAGLLLDGAKRRSLLGAGESIGGGALAGAAIGSIVPGVGTLIGAGVGAAVGGIAALIGDLLPTDRQQVKDQVKSLYKLDINNQIADQIIQAAKSTYGGSFSVAIRSKPILDLLSLYAQSTGQNFLFKNSPTPAYITQQGGVLGQQYTDIGGKAYSFGGSVAVANGVQTSVIPTYVAGQQTIRTGGVTYPGLPSFGAQGGTIQLDGAATTALLTGQAASYVSGNPTAVASAVADAQNGSYDRRTSAARLLSPGLLV